MTRSNNIQDINELSGLSGLTIEGYTGYAGDPGNNVFLGSKTNVSGTYMNAAVDSDRDGIIDSIWKIKANACYQNDFVLINEYNIMYTYVVKYYVEDSSGVGNYSIPSWMFPQLSTSTTGNYLVLEYFDRCIFDISSTNYKNNIDVEVSLDIVEQRYTGWDFKYPVLQAQEIYVVNEQQWSQTSSSIVNINVTETSNPNKTEYSDRYLKFTYNAVPVDGRNMKIIAQFTKNNVIKNGTVDSVVYNKADINSRSLQYMSYPLTTMGYVPNYDASINFDNEDLGDFVIILKSYENNNLASDFYLPYDKIKDYIIEVFVYLQTVDGLEEKIYLGEIVANEIN